MDESATVKGEETRTTEEEGIEECDQCETHPCVAKDLHPNFSTIR